MWNPSQLLVIWLSGRAPKTDPATAPKHRSSSKTIHCWWFLKAPLENRFETCNCSNFRQGIKLGSQSWRPWLLELVSNFTVQIQIQMSQLRPTVWKRELCHKLLWYPWALKCNWVSRLSSMSRFKRLRQPNTKLKSSKLLLMHVNTLSCMKYISRHPNDEGTHQPPDAHTTRSPA